MMLLIYILGFIITYIVCKIIRNKSTSNDWDDVLTTLLFSSCSYIGLFVIIIMLLIYKISNIKTKPPKFL